jgi:hypothetical protein
MRTEGGGQQYYDYVADRHNHLRHRARPLRGRGGAAPRAGHGVVATENPSPQIPDAAAFRDRCRAGRPEGPARDGWAV